MPNSRAMPLKHLIRLLTLLALLLAPAGMTGSHMAVAAPGSAGAGTGHCLEMAGQDKQAPDRQAPAKSIDCTMACSCLPSFAAAPTAAPPAAKALTVQLLLSFTSGLHPEQDPPPPRSS